MADEYFGIGLNTEKLEADAQRAKKAFDDIAEEAQKSGKTIEIAFDEVNQNIKIIEQETTAAGNSIEKTLGNSAVKASQKFDTLGFSIQQIIREMPTLAMSPQLFFTAISNNIPMFTEAIINARKEFEMLTESGQKGIPVWKQLLKSLFSVQTALSLIPTLLIIFGDDIANFFDGLMNKAKSLDYTKEAMDNLSASMLKGKQNAQEEIVKLNLLYNATQDVRRSVHERKMAVDELQKIYPDYFGNMKDEEILAGKAADAYTRLTTSIIESAKARAAQELMITNSKELLKLEQEITEAYRQQDIALEKLEKAKAKVPDVVVGGESGVELQRLALKAVQDAQEEVDKYGQKAGEARRKIYALNKANRELADSINIQDLIISDTNTQTQGKGTGQTKIDNLKNYLDELLDLSKDNEDRQIELMKDGTEKQIAQIILRYSRELEIVKKLRESIAKEQGGKLTVEQAGLFDTAISGIYTAKNIETEEVGKKQADQERADMQKYLAEYGNYWEKRKSIAEQYQEKIAAATTKWSKMSLEAEMTEALAKLDDEAQKKTSIITQLFGNMSKRSVQDMRNIADEAERMLEFIEGGEYDKNNAFGITEEQFKVLSQSPEKLESIKNEIANVRTEADRAEPIFERIQNQLEDIFNSSDTDKLSAKLKQLTNDLNEVMQVAGFLSDVFSKMGDSFGSDVLNGMGEGLNTAMNTMNSALQGAQAGALFESFGATAGAVAGAAGAAIGIVSSLSSAIAQIHDKKREKEIQKLQSQIDVLTKNYEALDRAVEKAYSKDASKLIEQQNELLEQQKVLIEGQIKEEKDKKKTDNDRIKEWEEQLDSINQQLEENKEKAIDVIFGEDVQAAIENFASAMTDAWTQGVDASESAKESVRRIMQQMVTESIKQMISSSGKMEEIRKKLQEFYADKVLTGWEQDYIYNMADQLQQQIDNKFGWAEDLFKKPSSQENTATSRGFGSEMTHEDAGELSGRFTALNETGIRIENKIDIGNVDIESIRNNTAESRDIIQSCYGELIEIRENTGAIVEPIKKMQKDMNEMKNTIKEKL